MNSSLATILASSGGVLAGMVGGVAGWMGIRHQHAGTVETADAETIFAAAEKLRAELRIEVEQLRLDVANLRIDLIRRDNRIQQLEADNERKAQRITHLESENARLTGRVAQLEAKAGTPT